MSTLTKISGGCLCGNLRLTGSGEPKHIGICHCLDCRRHHGAAFFCAAVFSKGAVSITGEYGDYEGRCFCPTCGSSVFAVSGDEIEVHLGALDEANQMTPTYELWTCRRENGSQCLMRWSSFLKTVNNCTLMALYSGLQLQSVSLIFRHNKIDWRRLSDVPCVDEFWFGRGY